MLEIILDTIGVIAVMITSATVIPIMNVETKILFVFLPRVVVFFSYALRLAATDLNFELAIQIRDKIKELES